MKTLLKMRTSKSTEHEITIVVSGTETEIEHVRAAAVRAVVQARDMTPHQKRRPCGCKGS